ncbi:MAG: hypothetical protein IVW55_14740 [Chloroflexi bacterium]|nr:hypothetical protein [Chloroflexota bacterium]
MNEKQQVRGPLEAQVGYRRWVLKIAWMISLFCAGALLVIQHAAAQSPEQDTRRGVACGQTRFVLVRFLDGNPASGVRTVFSAAPPSMGGPQLYMPDASGRPTGIRAQPDGVMPTLPTPSVGCQSVITGTLAAVTNAQGLARFDGLGEGTWTLRFEGTITRGHQTSSLVPAAVQGRAPYGRTRQGGGFAERIDTLNEDGGPNPQRIQPGVGATTSRYLLHFSTEYAGWLPGLDLASEDGMPPLPLADMTLAPWAIPGSTSGGGTSSSESGGSTESLSDSSSQESTFDPSSVKLVPPQDHALSEGSGERTGASSLNAWWAAVLGLTLGGVVAIVWGKRRRYVSKRAPR